MYEKLQLNAASISNQIYKKNKRSLMLTDDDGDGRLLANDLLTALDLRIQCHHVNTNVLVNRSTKYKQFKAYSLANKGTGQCRVDSKQC